MLKQALAVIALVGLAGCSAGVDVNRDRTASSSDYDRDNARVTYRSETDTNTSTNARTYDRTYDANARVASDRTSARYDTYNDRSNGEPIETDPIGRPELMSRKLDSDIQQEVASS